MDNRLPRVVRDSRVFMIPLYWVWFKRKHVRLSMEFKSLAPSMTQTEFRNVYRVVESMADGRETDTHTDALINVLDSIDPAATSLLDVGCGGGYFLRRLQRDPRFDALRLAGCDFMEGADVGRARYTMADIEALPFADRAFDVVTCFHTLEHTRRLAVAVAELKRICRRQIIVVIPRQQYFRYTFDLHLQFFPTPEALENAIGMNGTIRQFGSDLVYIAAP